MIRKKTEIIRKYQNKNLGDVASLSFPLVHVGKRALKQLRKQLMKKRDDYFMLQ